MSLFGRVFGSTLATPEKWVVQWLTGAPNGSGQIVNASSAQRLTAVTCAFRIISETQAVLPLHVYRQQADGTKQRDRTHPLYRLLRHQPNPWQTAFEFKRMLTWHAVSRGAGYAEILLRGDGQVGALVPLHSDRVRPDVTEAGEIVYRYTPVRGEVREIPFQRMFKLLAFSEDGVCGRSLIEVCQEGIGAGLAAESFAAHFWANQATPSGILKAPNVMKPDAAEKLRKMWQARYGGVENAARTPLLENGVEYVQLGMKMQDAQFIESRKFHVTEIARLFRLPPHMLGDLERATFTNIEHQGLEFVVHSMSPWLVMWEQAVWRDLLTEQDQEDRFAEHLVDALLRGDIGSRYGAYAVGRQWGWLSADDVREKENMNPLPDGQGRAYLTPLNMLPADQVAPSPSRRAVAPAPDRQALAAILADPLRRMQRREQQLLEGRKDKAPADALAGHAAMLYQAIEAPGVAVARLLAPDAPPEAAPRVLRAFAAATVDAAVRRATADPTACSDPAAQAQGLLDALTLALAGASHAEVAA